jgi:cell division protein FtsL
VRQRKPRSGHAQRRLAGGVVWIASLAVLLTGIVALNVAVLRLNVRLDELGRERTNLRAQNAAIEAELSAAAAPSRIEQLARRHGLVPAPPERTRYVDLRGERK